MRALFSTLVAASLLMHAAIGCCWHHPHDTSCWDESQAEQATEADCCHDHDDHDNQGQPPHGPCKNNCLGVCLYLPVQKTQVEQLTPQLPLDLAAIVPATGDMYIVAVLQAERSHETAAMPPVRRHLLHQLLQI